MTPSEKEAWNKLVTLTIRDGNGEWKVTSECVFLDGQRVINGCELLTRDVGIARYALSLRDKFDSLFPIT